MTGDDHQKDDDNARPPDDIPEVDAEIVVDDAAVSPEPFDDPGDDPADDAGDPASPTETATRRSFIGAGVLFFVGMVLVAIAAGAVWYFTGNAATEPTSNETAASTPAAIPDAETPDETRGAKIANDDLSGAKPVSPPPSAEALADNIAELATPAETIANADIQEAAKTVATDTGSPADIEEAADDIPPPTLSLEPEDTAPNQPVKVEAPPPLESTDSALAVDEENIPYPNGAEPGVTLDAIDAPAGDETAPAGNAVEAINGDNDFSTEFIATLETALAAERERTAALEIALDDAQRDMAATNEALADARAMAAAARAEISALRAENDALKTTPRQSPIAAGAVAINAILKTAETGAPYSNEMSALKRAFPESLAVAVLAQHAQAGAPPMSKIRNEFDAAARAGLATANRENADGVIERYGARIAGLFNLRPAAPQAGAAPGAVISRAEHAVDEGNILHAIEELQSLPTPAQEAMGDWIDLAHQRVEFDAALRSLNTEIAERARRPESL